MSDNNYTPGHKRKRPRPDSAQRMSSGQNRRADSGRRQEDVYRRSTGAGQYVDDGWGRAGHASDYSESRGQNRQQSRQNYEYEGRNTGGTRRRTAPKSDDYGNYRRMPQNDDYQRNPAKRKKRHTVGKIIAMIQAILSLLVLAVLFILNVLPMMYLAAIAIVLLLLWFFAFFSQFTRKSHIPGKIESVIMSIVLIFCSYYLLITQNMLAQITSLGYTVDKIAVIVMNDDPAQSLQDAAGYTFGIQQSFQTDKITEAVNDINEELNTTITTQTYDSLQAQVQALYDGEVGAIIYNEGFRGSVEELFPTFSEDTRELDSVEIRTKVAEDSSTSSDVSVTKEPFCVYISGNDGYGSVALQGRSDVNILVYVNPTTKQILFVTTPRDYYVEFPGVTNGTSDKLTHAGLYGVETSMNTLEQVYGTDIDYYVRVNFSSLIQMVDALGGVDVTTDYSFSTFDGKYFEQGVNHLNGEDALSYSRERKSLPNGDFSRGEHQQQVLMAMIQKAMSPAILTGYSSIMSSLEDSFVTSMSSGDITSLVRFVLSEGSNGWNFVSYETQGTSSTEYCYSLGASASVVLPDSNSIAEAQSMIQQLYDGQVVVAPQTSSAN